MTEQEYETQFQDINNQIKALNVQRSALKEKRIPLSPFKPGDKVLVTEIGFDRTTPAFIWSVDVDDDGEFKYTFSKVNKDGSMSRVSAGIYSWPLIIKPYPSDDQQAVDILTGTKAKEGEV